MTSDQRLNDITFLSINARSLFPKMDELCTLASKTAPLFIAIQETWCIPQENDSFFNIPGYLLFRRDRHRTGGGVCIYCRADATTSVERLHDYESLNEELWLLLKPKQSQMPLLVGTIYRPPNSPLEPFLYELETSLTKLSDAYPPHTLSNRVLVGDFNARCRNWCEADATDDAGEELHQLTAAFGLHQLTTFKTNIVGDELRSCIDLVFADSREMMVSSLPPLGRSDHLVIRGDLPITPPTPTDNANTSATSAGTSRDIWCWKKADVKALRSAVETADWHSVLGCEDPDRAWTIWKKQLLTLAAMFIPTRPASPTPLPRPWMTPEIAANVRLKHRLFRKYRKSGANEDWLRFKRQRNVVSSLLRKAKSSYVYDLENCDAQSRATHSLPRLHRLVACLTRPQKETMPALLSPEGELLTTPSEKATLLNKFFLTQAGQSAGDGVPPQINSRAATAEERLEEFTVSVGEVREALLHLDVTKAAGDDGVPTRLLRLLSSELAPCVHHIFQRCLATGTLPTDWKLATVTPIYKNKGNSREPTNYRPISLLSVLSKTLERIVFRQLYSHAEEFLPECQSGFRRADGTQNQLVRIIHSLAQNVDRGNYTMSCYFDLAKAFDRVWHQGLLAKLEHIGVSGSALRWLKNYLCGRQQRVRIGDTTSAYLPIPAGVPQGSVLGPLLFVIYTHDLPSAVTSQMVDCNLFADDTALTASSADQKEVGDELQKSVHQTSAWLTDWRLAVNVSKTTVLETTRRPSPSPTAICLNNIQLSRAHSHKHLGLMISDDLRWTAHIHYVLSKATPTLLLLRRLRSSLTRPALSLLYKLYVRPRIEYASCAWPVLPAHLTEKLERFQRKAGKIILRQPLYEHSNHRELLADLGWETLHSRRLVCSAVLGHRLATGNAPSHLSQVRFPERLPSYPFRHTEHFLLPTPNTLLFQNSPIYFAASVFNSLPKSSQTEKDLKKFKQAAKIHLLTSVCSCHLCTCT